MSGTPTIYFQSLNRNFTILGVDRQLFYLFVGLTAPIAMAGRLGITADFVAISIFTILHAIGMLITKADQQMLGIYRRHIHFRKYYSAQPGIHAAIPLLKPSVPFYEGKRGLV